MKEKMTQTLKLLKRYWMLAVGGLLMLSMAIALAATLAGESMQDDESRVIEAVGRNNISFAMFYIENDLFPENPVPANLHFLRLFTDFVEIRSSFSANFGEQLNINYTYVASTRFVISHATGFVGGVSTVFEEHNEISRVTGTAFDSVLNFQPTDDGEPGGLYTINLHEYLETFNNFLDYFDRQMDAVGVTSGSRNFSADLFVEFSYTINAPSIGLNENSTRGLRIPISTEVFTLEATGSTGFNTQRTIGETIVENLNTTNVFAFVALIFVGAGLVFFHFRLGSDRSGKSEALAESIMKKHANEIVFSQSPLELCGYKIAQVDDFGELLKLAINLGKHISSYKSDEKAEFCCIVDDFAYYYCIVFEEEDVDEKS